MNEMNAVPPFVAPTLYFHGTRAHLQAGDLIGPGFRSNFGSGRQANHVYFTATLDAAVWGAELAAGEGDERIYLVEPTGDFEDDPNLTDKKFPGNPTKSYRSKEPVRVIGELWEWVGHPPEVLQAMKDNVARLAEFGVEADD
jgi:rifampin ADP-ribosylating transferase